MSVHETIAVDLLLIHYARIWHGGLLHRGAQKTQICPVAACTK